MENASKGFSKLTKQEKIDWIVEHYLDNNYTFGEVFKQYWSKYEQLQELHDNFSENTVSNYYLPFGIAPNFLIDGKVVAIPMAIEESSVVAAASKAAKFWQNRGGFKTTVRSMIKSGQVHIMYHGKEDEMSSFYAFAKAELLQSINTINASMVNRGGGLQDIQFVNKTEDLAGYYQLHVTVDTRDAMGANFINTLLEQLASTLKQQVLLYKGFTASNPEVIMSILSNYVPECVVHVSVSCPINELGEINGVSGVDFARKFVQAVQIATIEPYRAVTHNKGIMNGIDAVVIATGNDFRAVEAGVHAYAARNGQYRSLSRAHIENDIFYFEADFPLALGTVGGMTSLHPLSKLAMKILGNPTAEELMRITGVCGLAQNFAALHSLVTTGIQAGHMKMHLGNMLEQIGATADEKKQLQVIFTSKTPSFSGLRDELDRMRSSK